MKKYGESLAYLYDDVEKANERYSRTAAEFGRLFGLSGKARELIFISAPGRTEISGNHTDHQHGSVLAAAVNVDVVCAVSPKSKPDIHIISEGHKPDIVELDDLSPRPAERGCASALIRGVAEWFVLNGYSVGGLDAYTSSQVLSGSGLSSSAAFEVAVGGMLNHLYNDGKVTPEEVAKAGQYSENVHFGKPSGLMDQMASSVGGFVKMDFTEPQKPLIKHLDFDLNASGYALCITDTKGSHADLTSEYTLITVEMREVSEYFGKRFLSEVNESDFYSDIPALRLKAGDRAILRALHFFGENARVKKQTAALISGDVKTFLKLVNESGESSLQCLQNIYDIKNPGEQGLSLALALSKRILSEGGGAWRVHGGGFAGTVQAYVPHDNLLEYRAAMDSVFGEGACRTYKIRSAGGVKLG